MSVQECSRKSQDDHDRAVNAVKELRECMELAQDLNDAANLLESSRVPGVNFVVRDDIPSCNSSQWFAFLESARPRFVLSTDGRTDGMFTFGPGSAEEVGTFQHWAVSHFLTQQAHILATGLAFVFFNGFKISERSVVGTIIQSLGRVARSLDIASASYVSSAQQLLDLHSAHLLHDQDIGQKLAVIIDGASKTHVQKCQELSSTFTRDLLSQICKGSVELNVLVGRVKTVITDNRKSYLSCFRVLSELAGKYAQPYPAGSSDEDANRVPSIASCFDPSLDEEEDSDDEVESGSEASDGSEDQPKTKVAKAPQAIKMFQEALLLLARCQLEDIRVKNAECRCKAELTDLKSRITELDTTIDKRTKTAGAAAASAPATPSSTPSPAATPKADPRDPKSIAAKALSRNTAPQVAQLSPEEKVEKCRRQVGIKEASLARAKEEGRDVTKAEQNLADAKADLTKAEVNLQKHVHEQGAQESAVGAQLQKDKEEVQKLR